MKGSLQDQLLNAGLIQKQKAKNIKTAKKKAAKNGQADNEAAELAAKARQEEQSKSQELNAQRKYEAEQKAIQAQIRQMIEMNSIKPLSDKAAEAGELVYNFTDNNKIKSLEVSAENHKLISRGIIAIARLQDAGNLSYHLIPADAARKISQRDSSSIVLLNQFTEQDSEVKTDDPYAAYEVPDDLMW